MAQESSSDLGALLNARGPMPAETALLLLAQVAEGLQAAHRGGLLHGDITTATVLVREDVAGLHASLGDPRRAATDLSVAADLHALGALLWAMVTGSTSYVDSRSAAPQLVASTPAQRTVNDVLRATLATDPAQRYPSAQALLDHLRAVPTSTKRGRAGLVAALVAGLVVALVVAAGVVGVVLTHDGDETLITGGATAKPTGSGPTGSETETATASPEPPAPTAPIPPVSTEPVGYAPERRAPAAEVPGAVSGGTVTVLVPDAGPTDLDPSNLYDFTGEALAEALLHRSLTQWVRDPGTGQLLLAPDLATDLGQPNDDFTQWSFTIRDGVRWEDGTEVTADDVAFGLSRAFDTQEFTNFPGFYAADYFEGGDTYRGPYSDKGDSPAVRVDGNVVIISMSEPFPDMPSYGALPVMGPVKRGAASRPPAYGKQPLATGPYRVQSFISGKELVMTRNEAWDPATDPGRHAYPDRYEFEFSVDPVESTERVTAPDSTAVLTDVADADFPQVSSALGDHAVVQPGPCVYYLAPDWDATGGDTPEGRLVRQAIGYGYPYDDANTAAGYPITRTPAGSLLTPGTSGRPDAESGFTYDPARAKQLLVEAGYGGERKFLVSMTYWTADPVGKKVQAAVTRGLRRAGFQVKVTPADTSPSVLYGSTTGAEGRINDALTLRTSGWCTDWPSGANVLPSVVGASASYEYARIDNRSLQKQIDQIPSLPVEDQPAGWAAVDATVRDDLVALIPRATSATALAFGEGIGGIGGEVVLGGPYYKDLYVTQ